VRSNSALKPRSSRFNLPPPVSSPDPRAQA
jgi:hypothetical protein